MVNIVKLVPTHKILAKINQNKAMGIYKELGYTTSISKVSENVFKRIIVCCNLIYFPTLHKSFWLLKTNISSKTVKNIFELDKWMLFHFPIFDRPFLVTQQKIFLYPLKSSENLWFSGVSRGVQKETNDIIWVKR